MPAADDRPAPPPLQRPPAADLALLALAVVAVSTAAPLIRVAAAPALAVAFWRNGLAAVVLVPLVAVRHRGEVAGLTGRERRLAVAAGVLLAAHFAAWIPSLSLTTVASAVALTSTQPVWAGVLARLAGERVPARAWAGIGLAVAGAAWLAGVDLAVSVRALAGDGLALLGGMLGAAYVTVGAGVRRTVGTTVYTALCYGTAAAVLLPVVAAAGLPLTGYDASTWAALVGLTVGAQLLGHSVLNRVLRTTSPTLVSVAILGEIAGATLLALVAFGEVPPPQAVPATALVAAGIVVVLRSGGAAPARPAPSGRAGR